MEIRLQGSDAATVQKNKAGLLKPTLCGCCSVYSSYKTAILQQLV